MKAINVFGLASAATSLLLLCLVQLPAMAQGVPSEAITLTNSVGLKWEFRKSDKGWALGKISLHGKEVEAQASNGMIILYNGLTKERGGDQQWLPASSARKISALAAKFSGSTQVEGVNFRFTMEIALKDNQPAATMNTSWSVDKDLKGWQVGLTYHDTFAYPWRCQFYPQTGNSSRLAVRPIIFSGVPGPLMYRPDMSMVTLFVTDIAFDYSNPITWTGNTGLYFEDQVTPPQFRVGGGLLSSKIKYSYPLQLIVSDQGQSSKAITQIARVWMAVNGFKIDKSLHVRTVKEAFDIFVDGRRSTWMWKEPAIRGDDTTGGYLVNSQGDFNFGVVSFRNAPSAYVSYRLYLATKDPLWRDRALKQMNFVLKAQSQACSNTDDPNYGVVYTAYRQGEWTTYFGGVPGWKPDTIAQTAKYLLLTYELVRKAEGEDHKEWYDAAVRMANWVMRQVNPDGGLPFVVPADRSPKPGSTLSARALVAFPEIARITGDKQYLDFATNQLEPWTRKYAEDRFYFTLVHPDIFSPDGNYDDQSIWNVIDYWLSKYDRTKDQECLERAVGDAYWALLTFCPKQLSWVKNPTQCTFDEQSGYNQYVCYNFENRMNYVIDRLFKLTKDPLWDDLDQRLIQLNLFTEVISGKNKGGFYERVSDPWLARVSVQSRDWNEEFFGIDSGGNVFVDNFCLYFFNTILDMGLVSSGTSK
jgi:hypothetical protein